MNQFESSLLRYLSKQQLDIIQRQCIGIGGAGGLGSNVAVALARTGFKHFEIIDKDVIEPSNLNRQDYTLKDIGRPKVEALKDRLLSINPDIAFIGHNKAWAESADVRYFKDCNIIVEAFDQAEWKFRFVEYYRSRSSFIVSGNGMAGLTGAGTTPPLRSAHCGAASAVQKVTAVKKIGNVYVVGNGTTSISDGHPPLAPRVIQCAAKMAEIVLDLTLGNEASLEFTA